MLRHWKSWLAAGLVLAIVLLVISRVALFNHYANRLTKPYGVQVQLAGSISVSVTSRSVTLQGLSIDYPGRDMTLDIGELRITVTDPFTVNDLHFPTIAIDELSAKIGRAHV